MFQLCRTWILFLLLLTGTYTQALDAEYLEYYEDSLRRLSAGEVDAALIQAKNALLDNPTHLPSRILLGNIYLRQGSGASAQKELDIALELGAARDSILLPLGDALLLQGKHQEILDEIVADSPQLRRVPEILILRGRAHYALGFRDRAKHDFEKALKLDSQALGALLGLSQVALRAGLTGESADYISRARDIAPDNDEVWFLNGNVLRVSGDFDAALAAYSRALQFNESHMRARMSRARLRLQQKDYKGALEDATLATLASKNDPEPPFIASQALTRLGQMTEARKTLQDAGGKLSLLRDDYVAARPSLLRIAAMLNFAQGNLEQAHMYLQHYVEEAPNDLEMHKELGRIKLELGDINDAIRVLYPAQRVNKNDGELNYLLGDALLRSGRYAEAHRLLEKAVTDEIGGAKVMTRLALSRMGLGESELALEDLKKALAVSDSSENLQAGIILTTVYIKRKQHSKALAVSNILLERAPNNSVVHNLSGMVYLAMNEPEQAVTAFKASHSLAKTYTPALYNLAMVELSRGDLALAEKYYTYILALNETAIRALIGMSEIAVKRNDMRGATAWLVKAVDQDTDSLEPGIRLINLYLATDELDAAFVAVENLKRKSPENPDVHVMYARVHAARDDLDRASKSYRVAARHVGFSGEDLLHIAAGQQQVRDYEGALKTLQKARSSELPLEALAATVSLNIKLNDLKAAMTAAETVVKTVPESDIGYMLQGDVFIAGKQYPEALETYRRAHEVKPGRSSIMGIYRSHLLMGENNVAREALLNWLDDHPGDAFVRRNLAVAYLAAKDRTAAQKEFERLYEEGDQGAVVLVHLARIYQLEGDSRARDYAKRALAANPTWSVALDTYAWILVSEGEPAKGLKHLREAVSRDTNPLIRYHLAVTLSELDRKDEAMKELESVLRAKADPSLILAARKLNEELSSGSASP